MKILLVDDQEQFLHMIGGLFRSRGDEVVTAANGIEALEKARSDPPECIVSDILMPLMDGFTLCLECRRDEYLRRIPFMFATGTFTNLKDGGIAAEAGADAFLLKAQNPDSFLRQFDQAMENAATRRDTPKGEGGPADVTTMHEYNAALVRKVIDKVEELQEANQRLQESEESYRSLFDDALDMIHIVDADGTIVDANRTELETLGYTLEEYIGKPLLEIIHPDSRQRVAEAVKRVFAGEALRDYELALVTKSGGTIDVEANVSPRLQEGKVVVARTIMRDVTERRHAERELRARLDELRRWHEVTLGREDRICELKLEVNELLKRLGEAPRYGG